MYSTPAAGGGCEARIGSHIRKGGDMMLRLTFAGLAVALLVGTAPALADEPTLKVNYNWTSPAETAAIKVLQKNLAERGVKWQDFAVVQHDTGANITVINMISGGNPPDVFLVADPGIYRDIKKMGLGFPLDDIFKQAGATQNFADAVKKNITVDGEIVKAPVAVHLDGM